MTPSEKKNSDVSWMSIECSHIAWGEVGTLPYNYTMFTTLILMDVLFNLLG